MENYNEEFLKLRQDFSQKCIAETMPLEFIKYKADLGLLNTDMDMQRQYVWTSSQEQELIDSILLNVRIPEFHALVEDNKWNICDGRQRFTCLFNFLDNKICFLKSSARNELKFLFEGKGKKIFFKDLPANIQADILNTTITIAKYTNLTRQEQILLFKKINNGTALSSLAKGLASYYYMRTDYSYFIEDLLKKQSDRFCLIKQEELESTIIRMLLLISLDKFYQLEYQDLEKYYNKFEDIKYMVAQREKVIQTLNRFTNIEQILNNRSWVTGFPLLVYSIYVHPELNKKQVNLIMNKFIDTYAGGQGMNFGISCIKRRIEFIEGIIQNVKEST